MPNYSGVWSLVEQGVAEKGGIWQQYVDMTGRAVFGGGFSNDYVDALDYVTIQSTGNASDFGDLIQARYGICGSSSSTRGLKWQGMPNPGTIEGTLSIDYITIASTGNASDFGDAAHLNRRCSALANDTRSVKAGGAGVNDDLMEYVTIASTGNTTSFGDLLQSQGLDMGAGSNTTRGIYYVNFNSNTIQYITIASTGNATDFGDASQLQRSGGSSNSSTRVFVGGGYNTGGSVIANIEYVTTASTGNGTDFGDLTVGRALLTGCSDKIRGLFATGFTSGGANQDVIDYITMASAGNATDFGNLTAANRSYNHTDISSAHGGLA